MTAGSEATGIGYSVFDTSEECYEYNENACFIAATQSSAKRFLEVACVIPRYGRIDSVSWDDLLEDYGCSGGEYAMEADAFARFKSLAQQHGVTFEAEPYDGDDSLMSCIFGGIDCADRNTSCCASLWNLCNPRLHLARRMLIESQSVPHDHRIRLDRNHRTGQNPGDKLPVTR